MLFFFSEKIKVPGFFNSRGWEKFKRASAFKSAAVAGVVFALSEDVLYGNMSRADSDRIRISIAWGLLAAGLVNKEARSNGTVFLNIFLPSCCMLFLSRTLVELSSFTLSFFQYEREKAHIYSTQMIGFAVFLCAAVAIFDTAADPPTHTATPGASQPQP